MISLQIFCDGGSRGNPGPAASAFVVKNTSGQIVFQQGTYLGRTTNNQAEYQAVLLALDWVSKNSPAVEIKLFLDSLLVASQLSGLYKIKEPGLKERYNQINTLIKQSKLNIKSYEHIPRDKNFLADRLVNKTLDRD